MLRTSHRCLRIWRQRKRPTQTARTHNLVCWAMPHVFRASRSRSKGQSLNSFGNVIALDEDRSLDGARLFVKEHDENG